MKVRFSDHALIKLRQRKISRKLVLETALNPDFIKPSYNFREERYKYFGKNWLGAVVIKENSEIIIITAHWVAKIKRK